MFVPAAVALFLLSPVCRAQDFEAEEAVEEAAEQVDDVNMVMMNEDQLASWVFGNQGIVRRGRDVRGGTEDALQLQIDAIADSVELTDAQRLKLELAGRGDIQRFMDRYEALLRECPKGPVRQEVWQEIWQKASPLQTRYRAGLHGRGSLFRKTIASALGPEQFAKYRTSQEERSRRQYAALVKATVATIDQKLPLTADQRARLTETVLKKTAPPEIPSQSYYRYYTILGKIAEIPEDELKPIFSDDEWKAFRAMLRQGNVGIPMEAELDE